MKTKIYIYIEEAPYRKGVERYIELIGGRHKDIKLVESPAEIKKDERAIILTDNRNLEIVNYGKTFYLSDHSSDSPKNICKYNNFENIISKLIEFEEEVGEKSGFKLLCLSSPYSGAGKSLIAREAVKILSERRSSALIQIYPSAQHEPSPYQLDSLLLSSMNGGSIDIEEGGDGIYRIAPFKLIEDYVELDMGSFYKLLSELNENKGIEYFVVETKHFLDKTSRELIKLADVNLIILEENANIDYEELDYIKGLCSDKADLKIITNKVRRLSAEDELPYIYGLEEGTGPVDIRYFSSTLRLIMEGL